VTKEDHNKAAALKYRRGVGQAPKNVAIGREAIAIIIIDLARTHGVPIHEDRNLEEILLTVDQYEEVPTLWYRAVANTLAFIHKMSGRL
jgi:type III secretion system FlhB-like substrate exporter